MSASFVRQAIARSPVFREASPPLVDGLAAQAVTTELVRNAWLWRAGDVPRAFVVLAAGLVKITRTSPSGRSMLCALFGAPQSVGDAAVVRQVPYPADAVVLTPRATAISIPADAFRHALAHHPEIGVALGCNMQEKLWALHKKIEVLSAGAVESRVAALFIKFAEDYGDELEEGGTLIPLTLSRAELGDLISSTVETVVRTMKRLERSGILDTTRRGFVINDMARLKAIANDGLA